MAYDFSRIISPRFIGVGTIGSATTLALDSAYVHYTSGDVCGCRFMCPVSQTSATLTVYGYVTAVTGSPTAVKCSLYDGPTGAEDVDRPTSAAALATSADVDCSALAAKWATFTLTATLVAGQQYYVLFHNATGTPTSNYPTMQVRALPTTLVGLGLKFIQAMSATAGFSADGTADSAHPAMVIKFSDGSLLGNPYVTTAAHANNSNTRGICFTPTEDIVVSGIAFYTAASALNGVKIRLASDHSDVVSATLDRGGALTTYAGTRLAPTTLTGGTRYEAVVTLGSSNSAGAVISMGEASPPADVQACTWPGAGYVDNTTIDNLSIMGLCVLIDDNPAISGSSGAGAWTHRMIGGGF
jgi:hypothetical protein